MSPAQPSPEPTHTRSPRGRARRRPQATKSEGPLDELHTRCAGVAVAAGIGYLLVLATTAVRPTAMNVAATVGLLIALGVVAGLSALGAILTWTVARMPKPLPDPSLDRQAETVEWAIRLGEDMADAFRTAPSAPSRSR